MSDRVIAARVLDKTLIKVARGQYAQGGITDLVARHRALMDVCVGQTLALESAALAHGLPIDRPPPEVQVAATGNGTSWTSDIRRIQTTMLPLDHVGLAGAHHATSIARTVVDLARVRPGRSAVLTWDAALRRASKAHRLADLQGEIDQVIFTMRGRRGIGRARALREFVSPLAESPMESVSRWNMRELGLPVPVLQYKVLDETGQVVGRTDFGWPELGVVGEYDGEGKYQEPGRPGVTAADVFRLEKRRQERIEDIGWLMVHWGKEEIRKPELMNTKILNAIRRADGRVRLTP